MIQSVGTRGGQEVGENSAGVAELVTVLKHELREAMFGMPGLVPTGSVGEEPAGVRRGVPV